MDEEPDMGRGARRASAPAAPETERAGYDSDFYSWSQRQGRLLREGRLAEIDRENVAEEIESLGREQFNKLESTIRVILIHMLKWDFQPERRSRSWAVTIAMQRIELEDILSDNPGLKPRIAEALARAYRKGRLDAANETNLVPKTFPAACPYSFPEITSRVFERE